MTPAATASHVAASRKKPVTLMSVASNSSAYSSGWARRYAWYSGQLLAPVACNRFWKRRMRLGRRYPL